MKGKASGFLIIPALSLGGSLREETPFLQHSLMQYEVCSYQPFTRAFLETLQPLPQTSC